MNICKFIALILFVVGCNVSGEGNITINANSNPSQDSSNTDTNNSSDIASDTTSNGPDSSTDSNTSNTESSSTESSSSEIFIDFEDSGYDSHFTASSYPSTSDFINDRQVFSSFFGNNSSECKTIVYRDHGGCKHTSISTFNLPISVEFEFQVVDPYWTGTIIGLLFYQDDGSETYDQYGKVSSGNNFLDLYWWYSYTISTSPYNYVQFIEGKGLLSSINRNTDLTLGNQGKIKFEVDALGNYTLTYTKYDSSKSATGDVTYSGQLSSLPQNFKIQIYQDNYYRTGTSYGIGQYTYIDNIKIIE